MEYIKNGERYYILNNFKNFNKVELHEWYNKLNNRIIFLNPIIIFFEQIDYDIIKVNKDLAQEYFEIKSLIELLETLKKK